MPPHLALTVALTLPFLQGQEAPGDPFTRVREVTLEVAREDTPAPPRRAPGLAVNGSIPGPTLRWREGDLVRATVRNGLAGADTSIHWHGLLLPNAEDGVPYLTTPPIPPGGEREFEFRLRQSGTYWYHSHSGLQEQAGVYGAIVIEPREGLAALHRELRVDREVVLVLSDWRDEAPEEVMRNLMRGSPWYGIEKGTAQSLWGAWRAGKLGDYLDRERRRMPAMDLSDVAYDHFLANGRPEDAFPAAAPGERVLVRVVNAGASTYFHLTSAAGPLEVVAADGLRVEPVEVRRLLMGIAETYDVVVTLPASGEAVELRATAQDSSGHAALLLGDPARGVLRAEDPPRAVLYGMDEMLRAGLATVSAAKALATAQDERPFAPYALLRALTPSPIARAAEEQGVRTLTMRLTGDMQRYRWSIDGRTLAEEPVVQVRAGEVVRVELVNDTMMHHPMHLHGHFFRVVTEAGAYSPVKHTVDVPPMGKRVIEFVADEEPGDWFFHCHLLYHMDAGMARVVSYAGQGEGHVPALDPKLLAPTFAFAEAMVLTHMTMGHAMVMRDREDYFVRWRTGFDEQHGGGHGGAHDDRERELDLGWAHYVDMNLSTLVGYRFTGRVGADDRFFGGVRYRLPYLVRATLTADDDRDLRVELEKLLQVTPRGALLGALEYDTNTYADWAVSGLWTLDKAMDLVAMYDSDHGFGVGFTLRL